MFSTKTLTIKFLIIIGTFCLFAQSAAQNVVVNNGISIIDTLDYLPYYYEGALDYNLMMAASKGHDSEIERLIKKGADIDAETSEGATPLIFAVGNNMISSVRILLSHYPDINKVTSRYETALHIAVRQNNEEIAEELIRAGADVDISDRNGAAPLHYASILGYFYMTDLLLYYDADCDKKTFDGTTPLMAAIWTGFADIADLLIQNGANLEARDNMGFTPFLIASQNGDTLLMSMLLKEGVDLYEKNNKNYNALNLAIGSNNKPAVEFLLSKGDKWASTEKEGINPYQVASAFGRRDLVVLLEKNNVAGKQGLSFDEISLSASAKINIHDIFTGISLSLKEPLINLGITGGCDLKPSYTRVLIKTADNIYYQYMDKSSIVYAGLFKDFKIKENLTGRKLFLSTSLMAAYTFGNKLKGTNMTPEARLRLVPSVNLKLQINHLVVMSGLEYMNSPFYRVGPLWVRTSFSYNFYLNKVRAPVKMIKWF